jgi:hypothetical protein
LPVSTVDAIFCPNGERHVVGRGNMLRNLGLAAMVFCLFGAQSANAQTANAQTAKPKWGVDGTGVFCTLSRTVEDAAATPSPPAAAAPTTLVLRTYPGTELFHFMVIRSTAPASLGPTATMNVSFSPSGGPFVKPVAVIPLGAGLGKAISMNYLPPAFLDAFAGAAQVNVAIGKKPIGSYAIPNAAKAVEALRQCESAKLVEWGADPAAFEPGGKQATPIGDPAKWVGYEDMHFPRDSTASSAGFAIARLAIDTDGHITACDLIDSNGNKSLNAVACKLLNDRARYEPAREKDGKAVRSVVLYGIDWRVEVTMTVE